MKRLLLAAALCFAMPALASAQYAAIPPDDPNHADTNPKETQKWFAQLRNRIDGGCCGEGDGYSAAIDEDASEDHPGRGHVLDRTAKEIWANGRKIKVRPALADDESGEFQFDYTLVTKEKFGTPLKTAFVFLSMRKDGHIDRDDTWIYGVYCVVPLPPSF
jgi:hypothetical protein